MKDKNITIRIKFYLIHLVVFINIIFSTSLWANYVNITKYGDQVMEFADALKNIIADYRGCSDKIKEVKITKCSFTYNYSNHNENIRHSVQGIDLTKKRLESIAHSFFIFNKYIGSIYKVFGSIEAHNPKVASIYKVIQFFYDDSTKENGSSIKLYCNLKKMLHQCSSFIEGDNLSILDCNEKYSEYIRDLNLYIYFIHTLHESLECDEIKTKTFFSYIASYADMHELSKNSTDYVSEISYYYLTEKLHNFSFAIALHDLFQSKSALIKMHHKIAKNTIKNICNDKNLEDVFSLSIKKTLDKLGGFHKELRDSIEELENK